MRDKIVEAKPRRLKKASSKMECSKSKSETSLKESANGSKSDLSNVNVKENGCKNEKAKFQPKLDDYKVSKSDLTSSKLVKKGSMDKSEIFNPFNHAHKNHETGDFLTTKIVNGNAWKTRSSTSTKIANGIGRPSISSTRKSCSLERQSRVRDSYSPIFSKDYGTFRSHQDVDDIKSIIKLNSLKNERMKLDDST